MKTIPLITVLTLSIALTACDKIQQIVGSESSVNHNNTNDKAILVTKKHSTNKRVALLIANADYNQQKEITELDNPINDLKLIQEKLTNLGYQITPLENATEKQMNRAIQQFAIDAKNADSAVFYYSGHGMQDEADRNYLIPVDAEIHSLADIESDGVHAYKIIDSLKKAKPRLSLVLFDACRNNPFFNQHRGYRSFGIKDYQTDNEFLISYATQSGKFAEDGDGENSPYARALASQLSLAESKPLLEMFDEVKRQVKRETNNEQSPTKAGDVEVRTMLFSEQSPTSESNIREDEYIKETPPANIEPAPIEREPDPIDFDKLKVETIQEIYEMARMERDIPITYDKIISIYANDRLQNSINKVAQYSANNYLEGPDNCTDSYYLITLVPGNGYGIEDIKGLDVSLTQSGLVKAEMNFGNDIAESMYFRMDCNDQTCKIDDISDGNGSFAVSYVNTHCN